MANSKEWKLTNEMDGFKEEKIDFGEYESSFRRWLVSQLDSEKMTFQEARSRFKIGSKDYISIMKRWQERYSEEFHLSLQAMSSKERADNKELDNRIKELEKQLELAQMKNVALNTMIDIAETDYKLQIRKKSGLKRFMLSCSRGGSFTT